MITFEKDTLSERVAEYIRQRIFFGDEYKKGTHLLETEIADRLEVSRATIREALKELENQGLVETIPRRGTFVSVFDRDDMIEIMEIRCIFEERIFETLTEGNLMEEADYCYLKEHIGKMVHDATSNEAYSLRLIKFNSQDLEFHSYIWKKSQRKWFCKILFDNYYRLRLAMMQDAILEHNLEMSARMHYDILDALKNGDCEMAKQYLHRHILCVHPAHEKLEHDLTIFS